MEEHERPTQQDYVDAAPTFARLAAGMWWRSAQWTLTTSVRASTRLMRAATSGESAADLVTSVGGEVRHYARRFLGVEEEAAEADASADGHLAATQSLRDRGAELLRRSADVKDEEEYHPAYDRILADLAPDEGRILRFLGLEGPQPSVDVRGAKGLPVSTQMIAPGLTMIGPQAGCRHLDRVPAYLNNLYRLGLIWFSREPLEDPLRYQVLEAQPDVLAALREAGRTRKTVRRSIHLTPFGDDFCATALPLHTAELDALGGSAESSQTPRVP